MLKYNIPEELREDKIMAEQATDRYKNKQIEADQSSNGYGNLICCRYT